MAMPSTARRYTVDEVLAFPNDGNRYELVDGELLVTPAPSTTHQLVIGELHRKLADYLTAQPALRVLLSPADITWDQEKLVQPDLFVVPTAELSRRWVTVRTLVLAVEVISPSSARGDRVVKRALYQRQGVATYWIVDPDARLVEIWNPGDERPQIMAETVEWQPSPDTTPLTIDVAGLFSGLPE